MKFRVISIPPGTSANEMPEPRLLALKIAQLTAVPPFAIVLVGAFGKVLSPPMNDPLRNRSIAVAFDPDRVTGVDALCTALTNSCTKNLQGLNARWTRVTAEIAEPAAGIGL